MNLDPTQQDMALREFEKIFARLSLEIKKMRADGFQQVTLQEGREFPLMMGYQQTGPSIMNNYTTNQQGPAIPPINGGNNGGGGGPGGGGSSPGEGGNGGGGGGGGGDNGTETRFSCIDGQCVADADGVYLDLEECRDAGCTAASTSESEGTGGSSSSSSSSSGGSCTCPVYSIMAELLTATGPTLVGGNSVWTYTWQQVDRPAAGAGWIATVGGRTSGVYGAAYNQYEVSVPDNGGNIPPTGVTLTRLQYPLSIVPIFFDANNRPWFSMPNPLQAVCPP